MLLNEIHPYLCVVREKGRPTSCGAVEKARRVEIVLVFEPVIVGLGNAYVYKFKIGKSSYVEPTANNNFQLLVMCIYV